MKARKPRLAWLAARKPFDPAPDQVYAGGVGQRRGQWWHRCGVSTAAEPLEKHRLVWTTRRDDPRIRDTEVSALWRHVAGPRLGEGRRKP